MLTPRDRAKLGAALTLLAGMGVARSEVPRLPVEDFRVLLVAAIDSPTGDAHGVMVGPMVEAMTARIEASSPLLIDVTTLFRYQQDGCRRLNVRFWQQGVSLTGTTGATKPQDQTFDLGLNYCRDGRPPRSLK